MRNLLLGATLLAGLGASPASAALVDWNFGDHVGLLGNTQSFTSETGGLFNLTGRGFDVGDHPTRLFSKTGGGDENGLGLHNDPTGDNEISLRHGFVQLNLDGLLSKLHGFEFSMGSTSQGEGWKVFGSEDAHPFQFTLLDQSTGSGDEGLHSLPGGWDNYSFFYSGGASGRNGCGIGCGANVLVESFAATTNVPEPKTWAMLGIGFAAMAFLGYKRSRKDRLATI